MLKKKKSWHFFFCNSWQLITEDFIWRSWDIFFQGNQQCLVSADLGWLLSPSSPGFANSKKASLAHSLASEFSHDQFHATRIEAFIYTYNCHSKWGKQSENSCNLALPPTLRTNSWLFFFHLCFYQIKLSWKNIWKYVWNLVYFSWNETYF